MIGLVMLCATIYGRVPALHRFGYVMDVYMPRDKHNRAEHRGFGFVTFETVAAVQRVAVHGSHQINVCPTPSVLLTSFSNYI